MKRRCIAAFSNICKLLRSPLIRLAVRSTPSSVWEKAFIVVRFSRNLASLHNYCHPPRLFSASSHAPVAADSAAGRRACVARPKGKSEGMTGRSLLHTRQHKVFPATGGGAAVPPSSFINLTFTSHTGSLLLSSPKKVTSPFVPFVPFVPPPPSPFAIKKAKLLLRRSIAIRVSLFHPEAGLAAVH